MMSEINLAQTHEGVNFLSLGFNRYVHIGIIMLLKVGIIL
jgi:hypothetical protein